MGPDFRSPVYLQFVSCCNACSFPCPPPFYFAQWWWTSTWAHWTYLFMSFNPDKLLFAVLTKFFWLFWLLNFYGLLRRVQSCLKFFVCVFRTIMLLVLILNWFVWNRFVTMTKNAIFGIIFWSCNFLLWLFWQLGLAAWSFGIRTFLIWIVVTIGLVIKFITGLLQLHWIWIFCIKSWSITVNINAVARGRIVPEFYLILLSVQQGLEIFCNLISRFRHFTNWMSLASK